MHGQHFLKKKFNIKLDEKLESLTRGVSRIESLNALLNHYNIVLTEAKKLEYATEKNELYVRLIGNYNKDNLLDGAFEVIKKLKDLGVKIALGSASRNGPILLEKLGINHWFDYVVDPTNLASKPDPAIFLDAVNHFLFKKEDCVGFEDAVAGVNSIKAAGLLAIGVGNEPFEADVCIKDLASISKNDWQRILK